MLSQWSINQGRKTNHNSRCEKLPKHERSNFPFVFQVLCSNTLLTWRWLPSTPQPKENFCRTNTAHAKKKAVANLSCFMGFFFKLFVFFLVYSVTTTESLVDLNFDRHVSMVDHIYCAIVKICLPYLIVDLLLPFPWYELSRLVRRDLSAKALIVPVSRRQAGLVQTIGIASAAAFMQ